MNLKISLIAACVGALVPAVLTSACIPAHLQKYRTEGTTRSSDAPSVAADMHTPPAATPSLVGTNNAASASNSAPPLQAASERATIYAIDAHTYRFQLREADVWNSALNVLLRNYNLTIVDRQTGIVTTEWDSFYLDNAVYRNKVSLRVAPGSARGAVDVTIHNSVERLRDASQAAGTVGAVWLPAEDPANETARIVQNMALLLNQPPPVLPPKGMVAKGQGDGTVRR